MEGEGSQKVVVLAHRRVKSFGFAGVTFQVFVVVPESLGVESHGESGPSRAFLKEAVFGPKFDARIPVHAAVSDDAFAAEGEADQQAVHQADAHAGQHAAVWEDPHVEVEAAPGKQTGGGTFDQGAGF